MAPHDVKPGRPYAESCVLGIEACETFVLFSTQAALNSVQVLAEIEQAHKRGKPILALMVGRPTLSREADYYLSRLHWLEASRQALPAAADRLAEVLGGKTAWRAVARPPTLLRHIRHRREAMVGSAAGAALVLIAAGVVAALLQHRNTLAEDLDPNALGLVSVSIQPLDADTLRARVAVYLNASGVRYAAARLVVATQNGPELLRRDLSGLWNGAQQGGAQVLELQLPAAALRLTTCLSVPHPRLHSAYRVTWVYGLRGPQEHIGAYLLEAPTVQREDGGECGKLAL